MLCPSGDCGGTASLAEHPVVPPVRTLAQLAVSPELIRAVGESAAQAKHIEAHFTREAWAPVPAPRDVVLHGFVYC